MASLRNLTLPPLTAEESSLGWDETIGNTAPSSRPWERPSLCSHAMAHGTFVCGVSSNADWITWKTSFSPHRVCRVASNQDGSVVAASTDGGTVSLLCARDGKVLATRRVSEGTLRPPEVAFVSGSHRYKTRDVLIILVPTSHQLDASNINILLVSNIDGVRLNDENVESVAEAAKRMSIDALRLETPCKDVESLQGCFLNAGTIRFAAGEADGNVSIHDYYIGSKQSVVVKKRIDESGKWTLLTSLGMRLQNVGNENIFLLLCGHVDTFTKLFWYDIVHLNIACKYALSTESWLLALEPITSFSDEEALAVAVAMKASSREANGFVQVVQVVAEETMGLTVLTHPHTVYHIPLDADQLSLQGIDLEALEEAGPYSFRFRMCFGSNNVACSEFITRPDKHVSGGLIGKIRLLLQREMYDEVDEILATNIGELVSSDSFAGFHSSEVALRRLQRLLLSGDLGSEENMEHARECLCRLVAGAVSNSESGQKHFLEAVDSVLLWPTNEDNNRKPSVFQFSVALTAMLKAMDTALKSVSTELRPRLESKKMELEHCLSAVNCIDALVQTGDIDLGSPFLAARSPSDVFIALVEEGFFSVAEKMWRSGWGRDLTAETLASSILSLTPMQDPHAYATLLMEAVIPNLSITHEAIPLIRAWACRCADAFDADESSKLDLGASIFLLKTVLSAIQQLNRRMHSSFASYSPFTERRETIGRKSRQPSPRIGTLDKTVSSVSSEGTAPSEQRRSTESVSSLLVNQHPTPTLLELGFLKRGAMKSTLRSLPKRKSGDAPLLLDDGIGEGEESVEIKLRHARHLEKARELGLPWSVVTLHQYMRFGGTERIATELVRIHSSSSSNHEERYVALTSKVKPFCDESGVDYDQILLKYNSDLCDSKRTSAKTILESSSVARCCVDPLVKCEIALAVLRVALLSGKAPSSLTQLSRDAIAWASVNAALKSEIEEATRLLVVDGIVRKYCGPAAGELFRVDNPLHAVRLVDFVSRHFKTPSVLSDLLDLCDAFTFLRREEACTLVLERAAEAGETDLCVKHLGSVFALGNEISENVARRVIKYCDHTLEEACSMISYSDGGFQADMSKKKAIKACRVACSLAEACHAHFHEEDDSSLFLRSSFSVLLRDFERIQRLQANHNLFLPLSVFDSPSATLRASRSVLKPVVESFVNGNLEDGEFLLLRAKAACSILSGLNKRGDQSIWYTVAGEAASHIASSTEDGRYLDFLAATGILNDFGDEDAVNALLSVALTLCRRASNESFGGAGIGSDTLRMEDVIRASSLVHDYALISCSERMLVALVSIALLTETASQVLLRADEGLGEALESLSEKLAGHARMRRNHVKSRDIPIDGEDFNVLRTGRPMLHTSWYVGDGLLLPPRDALHSSVAYCRDLLDVCLKSGNVPANADGPVELHRFLGERGAHAAALRIVCVYTSMALSAGRLPSSFDGNTVGAGFLQNLRNTLKCLCERSLGGSGSGITSVTIDSQLAVTFLLSLPLKVAFKVYQAPLPIAITKRDFSRVITLSNIGVRAGDEETGWKKQSVFIKQCLRLSSRARWWKVLKHYQVDFDPSQFEGDESVKDDKGSSVYVASLVPELISKASLVHKSTDLVRDIATKFATAFGLDPLLAAQKHVEHVLSCPPVEYSDSGEAAPARSHGCSSDIRWNLSLCERAARDSLRLISSPMKRSAVLRRCMISLENNSSCDKDYERHAMVLSLYHADLSLVVAKDPTIRNLDASAFEEELELIERRRDTLAVLLSFFQAERSVHRPSFPKFFVPLPVPFKVERGSTDAGSHDTRSILGIVADPSLGGFDPLGPLQDFLSSHMDDAAVKALAPLTIPLGLPHGSFHARCLMERFRRFRGGKGALPSFNDDVLPVLNRLKQSSDQCRLAEWCAAYYGDDDSQKLQCLDYGLRYAMTASSEVEKRMCFKSKSDEERLAADERHALDAVKRLSEMHSALSDRLEVTRILRSANIGSPQHFRFVETMIQDLTKRLQKSFWASTDSSPEQFVEVLLVEASLLASDACLEPDISFSVSQFRHMASVVHQACKRIAEQYSHVHPGDISRCLARRWLVHGDELSSARTEPGKSQPTEEKSRHIKGDISISVPADEDDTVDFVMDLNSLGEAKAVWSDDIGSVPSYEGSKTATISIEEEPSALKPDGSTREAAEIGCIKVALRVAFVMSFAEGYYRSGKSGPNDEENINYNANTERMSGAGPKKSRPGLLSRISTKDSNSNIIVMEHARELLGIVFAKSGGSDADTTMSFIAANTSIDETSDARKTLTFAMRYRALRSAAVLCPQAALDKVVSEEGYLATGAGDVECSLQKCTYGAFVAKEIEEMGLPLPHSDLVQLSTMHYPSYARALWRHHRNGDIRGKKGRLLLLLLEMSLKDNTDSELTVTLLNEMSKLQLARTLLLGCECIATFKQRADAAKSSSLLRNESMAVSNAVFTAANLVLTEVHRSLSSMDSKYLDKGLPTVRRVANLVQIFSDTETGQRQLSQFIKVLVDLISLGNDTFSDTLADVALNAARCLSTAQSRQQLFRLIAQHPSGEAAISRRGKMFASDGKGNQSTLKELFFEVEASYDPFTAISRNDDRVNEVCDDDKGKKV